MGHTSKCDRTPNIQQTADIFKSNIDCFEEEFDYLSHEELISIGQTCKRLRQVAGYILQQNYVRYTDYTSDQGVHSNSDSYTIYPKCFYKFIHKIRIKSNEHVNIWRDIQHFHRLSQIFIDHCDLTTDRTKRLEEISNNILLLSLNCCRLNGSLHDLVLDHCSNLKHLSLRSFQNGPNIIGNDNLWMQKRYPTIQIFELLRCTQINELATFLEINQNIRDLGIDDDILIENQGALLAAIVQLDVLAVMFWSNNIQKFNTSVNLLQILHERGFFKYLKLSIGADLWSQESISQLASMESFVRLTIKYNVTDSTWISTFTILREIYFKSMECCPELSRSLINLKRLRIDTASFDVISPFIRRSVNLSRIVMIFIQEGSYFNSETKIIDLEALNREREKLDSEQLFVQKITLYVREKIYLATKWALGRTDFSFIQLKRTGSRLMKHENDGFIFF